MDLQIAVATRLIDVVVILVIVVVVLILMIVLVLRTCFVYKQLKMKLWG